ncbi:MAG: hypothetical protein AB1801_05485 [Chloroflexota bacterium]
MTMIVTSAPAKTILFGDHGVNRHQPALATAVDLRTFCRVTVRRDEGYSFRSGARAESGDRARLLTFKADIDALREAKALDEIRERAQDFFAPPRYVLASLAARLGGPGLDIEWTSPIPIGSGLGSGAAASTALALAAFEAAGRRPEPQEVIYMAWQGDVIAHGGIGSSLDSSTSTLGGLVRFTLADGATPLPGRVSLPLVIGDTRVQGSTAAVNTYVRKWVEAHPARMHLFKDMGFLIQHVLTALEKGDLPALGHLMNLHQLIQEKIGTACPESERLIEAAIGAGALGAKISGSGGGGIIIALVEPDRQTDVAAAIDAAGGRSLITSTGVAGARVESVETWEALTRYPSPNPSPTRGGEFSPPSLVRKGYPRQ